MDRRDKRGDGKYEGFFSYPGIWSQDSSWAQQTSSHLFFDARIAFERKYRWVKDGHITPEPK